MRAKMARAPAHRKRETAGSAAVDAGARAPGGTERSICGTASKETARPAMRCDPRHSLTNRAARDSWSALWESWIALRERLSIACSCCVAAAATT